MSAQRIATVIVTFNRLELLKKSIDAHLNQTQKADMILIVDNCSTDGTSIYLEQLIQYHNFIKILSLTSNTGGSGGFHAALEFLGRKYPNIDWVWMMDDDAIPATDALKKLLNFDVNPFNIYGSVANRNGVCSWENINLNNKKLKELKNFDSIEEVSWIPFLGFFINKKLVEKIGLPQKEFFLAADDVEYSLRAKRNGARIFIVRDSLLDHPCSESYRFFIGYRFLTNLKLVPWKRYYDVRNRLFVSKKYYGWKYFFQTIPASFLRLFVTLIYEKDRLKQMKAFLAGFIDGVFGKSGKRHDYWKL